MPKIFKTQVREYLLAQPLFRERSNKDKGIANLLMRKYPQLDAMIKSEIMTKDVLAKVFQDYASMDRAWRKCLEDDASLRGTDYKEKERLEEETIDSLYDHE